MYLSRSGKCDFRGGGPASYRRKFRVFFRFRSKVNDGRLPSNVTPATVCPPARLWKCPIEPASNSLNLDDHPLFYLHNISPRPEKLLPACRRRLFRNRLKIRTRRKKSKQSKHHTDSSSTQHAHHHTVFAHNTRTQLCTERKNFARLFPSQNCSILRVIFTENHLPRGHFL